MFKNAHITLHDLQLTALRYDLNIPAEGTVEIPYAFYSEFAPGELALTVFVDVLGGVSRSYG